MTNVSLSGASVSQAAPWSVSLAIAAVPAIAAVIAALVAARSARLAKKSEISAQYARDLEARISEKKYEVYKPMINLIRDMLDRRQITEEDSRSKISDFATWVIIFGSDEAVRAFHHFMQAAYHSAPPKILMKLYADFVLAARRDMGYPETDVRQTDFLGMRITDIYENDLLRGVDDPLADLCREAQWSPPWRQE
ncbi:hypothetical protein ACIPYS_00340 [Kitasatospora sp. NPDC089913]|uniref:hypothetical protein n=1 Tax=Kitasatospora sp. NPDC089913 TaxID=3364080 RepID=UPI0037FE2E55